VLEAKKTSNQYLIDLMCRAVTVFKPKPNPRFFWRQMNGFVSLDNRQDLQLRPNWDRCNKNDERACLSALNFYLHTKMQ